MNQDQNGHPQGHGPMPHNSQPPVRPLNPRPEPPFEDLPPAQAPSQSPGAYQAAPNYDYNPQAQGPQGNNYTGPYNPQTGAYQAMNQTGYTGPLPGGQEAYNPSYANQAANSYDDYQAGQAYASRPQGPGPQAYDQQRKARGPQAAPKQGRQGPAANYDFTQQLKEFTGLFKHFFSANPSKSLNQDLSLVSWIILLVANILFYALAQATFASQGVFAALSSLGDFGGLFGELGDLGGSGWGRSFGLSLVQQIFVLLLYFLAAWLFSGMGGEAKLPPLQYLKLVSYTTILHSLLHFIIIFVSLISVPFASTLLLLAQYTLFFSFTYVLDSIYPKSRASRYWLYFILLFLITVVG